MISREEKIRKALSQYPHERLSYIISNSGMFDSDLVDEAKRILPYKYFNPKEIHQIAKLLSDLEMLKN